MITQFDARRGIRRKDLAKVSRQYVLEIGLVQLGFRTPILSLIEIAISTKSAALPTIGVFPSETHACDRENWAECRLELVLEP
jgi:hypothetical protein